jgi:DNA-binding winged helix-turn-helix (wHTH) protein
MRLAFGDCVFDSGTREVWREGRVLDLAPKAFALLELLIARQPNAVPKEEIHERLWPGTFVSDASVANQVAELRAALGDDARRPRIIRTVHRFGYAFVGDSGADPAPKSRPSARQRLPVCRLLWDGREIRLSPGENLIGREEEVAVWIDDSSVSRRHARIVVDERGATVEDLGSKNGTLLGGVKIRGVVGLADRDELRVGPARMVFRVYRQAGSTATASGSSARR